jgi:hypothetical protein
MSRETMCGKCCKKGDPLRQLMKSPTMRLAECQACARTERRKRVRLEGLIVAVCDRFGGRGWKRATYHHTDGSVGYTSGVTLPVDVQEAARKIKQAAVAAGLELKGE